MSCHTKCDKCNIYTNVMFYHAKCNTLTNVIILSYKMRQMQHIIIYKCHVLSFIDKADAI